MPYGKTKLSKKDMESIKLQYKQKQKGGYKLKKTRILKKRKRKPIREPKKFKYDTRGDFIGGGFFFK